MGQALCKRTLRMVERLNKHAIVALKSKYYITKADTIPSERDRHKVKIIIGMKKDRGIQAQRKTLEENK